MPDTPLDRPTPAPDDPGPLSPEDAAFDARLARLDRDDALADLVAARSGGTATASDRALWALVEARRATDAAFRARVEALEARAAALAPADALARFRRLAAAHPMPGTGADPAVQALRETVHRTERRISDRAPSARVREARPRWRTGVLAALVLLAGAVVVLRGTTPRIVDPSEVAAPEALRGEAAPEADPQAAYDRAAAALGRAERSVFGIHTGVDDGALASARAALDSVVAATPRESALHLNAQYLRGVACQLAADRACAQDAFATVVGFGGPYASQARERLASLAR